MFFFKKLFSKLSSLFKKYTYTPYVRNYLFDANIQSSLYVGIIVSLLEIWMLITVITGTIITDGPQSFLWIIKHTAAYLLLLFSALAVLVYAILYLKGKVKNKAAGYAIRIVFTVIGLSFGLYISYASYDMSGQAFVFITMLAFCLCLFVWHPVNAFIILSISFLIYIYLRNKVTPITYSMKVNTFTLWIAFFMTAINLHHQRRIEAEKDENLENMTEYLKKKSISDELTGLPNMTFFYKAAERLLKDEEIDFTSLRFVFIDVENFKSYNEKYGFKAGTQFLKSLGQIMQECFPDDLIARYSDDHFVALTMADGLLGKIQSVKDAMRQKENFVKLGLKTGIYAPPERTTLPSIACDYARYACASIKKHFCQDFAEYDEQMGVEFTRKQYIINNIDKAISNGFIKVYYQPVVWAKTGKLCGLEALARWDDPEFGFLPPGAFISVLEEYHLIHKLDMYIMETVCKDIQQAKQVGLSVIPVSINFSQLDFELLDPVETLDRCIKKYELPKSAIHVEITETALVGTDARLKEAFELFRAEGYSLWLDDFGSGYSGLNVLKDFTFDMMKIDMKFLSQFSENKKTQPIIASIVELASKIGIQTLTEGVETQETYAFLREIGCLKLQGYLFGKPMPKEMLDEKIKDGTYDLSEIPAT